MLACLPESRSAWTIGRRKLVAAVVSGLLMVSLMICEYAAQRGLQKWRAKNRQGETSRQSGMYERYMAFRGGFNAACSTAVLLHGLSQGRPVKPKGLS